MNAMPITLNSDPLAKSKVSLDVMSRHAAMPFAPFEREQQGKSSFYRWLPCCPMAIQLSSNSTATITDEH